MIDIDYMNTMIAEIYPDRNSETGLLVNWKNGVLFFPDGFFDCSYMIDSWWWLQKDKSKAGNAFSRITKMEAVEAQSEYENILKEI